MKNLLQFVQEEKHMSMKLIERINSNHPDGIYIYGAGWGAFGAVRFMEKHQIRIKAILDTYRDGLYENIPIIRFSDFLESSPDPESLFFISSPSFYEAIADTIAAHFPRENIYAFETDAFAYSHIPDLGQYRSYLLEHWNELTDFFYMLSDEKSRETFVSVIKGRLSADHSYSFQCFDPIQYYPPDLISLSPGEVMVELGGFDGGTLLEFIERCPEYQSVYCFEALKSCQLLLNEIADRQNRKESIHIIPKAAWDSNTTLQFVTQNAVNGAAHITSEYSATDSYLVETGTVDDIVQEPVSFMKMDIEGAELRALHGAKAQIAQNKPKLAVCVYHRPEDFLDIWHYLRSLVPEYQFYLRHHEKHSWYETVLYAIMPHHS